jgi:hypothetical protein
MWSGSFWWGERSDRERDASLSKEALIVSWLESSKKPRRAAWGVNRSSPAPNGKCGQGGLEFGGAHGPFPHNAQSLASARPDFHLCFFFHPRFSHQGPGRSGLAFGELVGLLSVLPVRPTSHLIRLPSTIWAGSRYAAIPSTNAPYWMPAMCLNMTHRRLQLRAGCCHSRANDGAKSRSNWTFLRTWRPLRRTTSSIVPSFRAIECGV